MFPFSFISGGAAIDAQAQAHFDRVIADGGLVPSGLSGVNAFFTTVKTIYATADITTAISVGLDAQVLGYKLGAGAGTTAGQAAQKLYSCSGASGDVVQTTAASQPLLLVHSGANYFFSPKIAANYCSTPSNNVISTDFEIIVKLSTFNVATDGMVISKQIDGFQRSFYLYYVGNQTFNFEISTNGSSTASTASSTSYGISNNDVFWIKVNRTGTTFNFYKSTDGVSYSLINTTTLSGAIFAGNSPIRIGDGLDSVSYLFAGKIYRATISNSIGGSPVVDFNPNQYNAANSQTQWTSSTGEIWTINTGTATTGYKGVLVDRTIVQGDGIDDGLLTSATINMPTVLTIYGAIKGYNNEEGSGKSLFGKSNIDGNVYRKSATELGGWIGSAGLAYYGVLANVTNLNLVTFKRKVSDNVLQANNGSIVNNTNSSAIVNSTISMFSVTTFGSSNGIVNTGVISFIEDNSTQRTAMYNYIRSINNNAF
jgi:hypothetical protein